MACWCAVPGLNVFVQYLCGYDLEFVLLFAKDGKTKNHYVTWASCHRTQEQEG
jgi:hypothetical protein